MEESMTDIIQGLEKKVSSTSDVGKAMEEFFKDKKSNNPDADHDHDIDLRSRLVGRAVRGHSVINFLSSFIVAETKEKQSLAEGLGVLSRSMKRHVLSFEGKSRQEIIDLFKSQAEANKPNTSFNMFAPQK